MSINYPTKPEDVARTDALLASLGDRAIIMGGKDGTLSGLAMGDGCVEVYFRSRLVATLLWVGPSVTRDGDMPMCPHCPMFGVSTGRARLESALAKCANERDHGPEGSTRLIALQAVEARALLAEIERLRAEVELLRKERAARHQAKLVERDGWMCEEHPGVAWPHGDCAGPGMPWLLEGREEIERALRDAP